MFAPEEDNGSRPRVEWKANTGPISLLRRTIATMWAAHKVSKSVEKLRKELSKEPDISEEDRKQRWTDLHRRNAKMTFQHIHKYRGFLTKVGQAMSTRAGELPAPWVEELKGLQDQLPESRFEEVRRSVQADLGKPISAIFKDFSERPIASASIAQAHVAILKSTGEKVCVKVQHRGVDKLMSADLSTVEYIARRMCKQHSDAPDLMSIVKEWRRASNEEVDFRLEQDNMIRASRALERAGIDVGCPVPVKGLCGRHTLTMSFVEGWKITEVARLPRGTDREELGRRLVDAFAALTFEEGLIHGDPHPGNVFVSPVRRGGDPTAPITSFRPVLLDWGIVQRVNAQERNAMARWVLATLTEDRFMYLRALQDLGFEFKRDFEVTAVGEWLHLSAWGLRDSIPSSAQLQFKDQLQRLEEEPGGPGGDGQGGRDHDDRPNLVQKVPGTVLFFLRALEMLQQVCGTLDAIVPFSQALLRRSLPLLQPQGAGAVPAPAVVDVAACRSPLEFAVRAKLAELTKAGFVVGAQVAVLVDGVGRGPGEWRCSVATGRLGCNEGPLDEGVMMPLLDVGVGVLVACFLAALGRPTAAGQTIDLDTPVSRIWPEFARRGKGQVTIGQLLRNQAGLKRPYAPGMTLRTFCHDLRLEEVIAAAPHEPEDAGSVGPPCGILGELVAAMLRRTEGTKSVSDALAIALRPVGLQEEIRYGPAKKSDRLALLSRRPLETLPLARAFEWLEAREREQIATSAKRGAWLSRREFAGKNSVCYDPLLMNREDILSGETTLAGRGLRASARALCQLYAVVGAEGGPGHVPADVLRQSQEEVVRHVLDSQEAWEGLARCDEAGAGWQLFRFRREDGSEVRAYGHADGATGSFSMRLPGASVSVLLNSVDSEARHVGTELIAVIGSHFGLSPVWHLEPPKGLSAKNVLRQKSTLSNLAGGSDGMSAMRSKIRDLEERLAQLLHDGGSELQEKENGDDFEGEWSSVEIEGLETLLEAFDVPVMARMFLSRLRRTLKVQISDGKVTLACTTVVAGKTVEDTSISFVVGEAFEGEEPLFGGVFEGSAAWEDEERDVGRASHPSRALVVEKQFGLGDREIVLRERFFVEPLSDDLLVESVVKQGGEHRVQLREAGDLDRFILGLDAQGERLVREVEVGGQLLQRGGRLVDAPAQGVGALSPPCALTLHYDDLVCRTRYRRKGGARPRRGPMAARAAEAMRAGAERRLAASAEESGRVALLSGGQHENSSCVADTAYGAALLFFQMVGTLIKACQQGCMSDSPATARRRSGATGNPVRAAPASFGAHVTADVGAESSVLSGARSARSHQGGSRGASREGSRAGSRVGSRHGAGTPIGGAPSKRSPSEVMNGAGVWPWLEDVDQGASTAVSAGDCAARGLDKSELSRAESREATLMQLLQQQQAMQQQLVQQLSSQQVLAERQALVPQQLQAQQAHVQRQLAAAQRDLAEQALAHQRLAQERVSWQGTGTHSASSSRAMTPMIFNGAGQPATFSRGSSGTTSRDSASSTHSPSRKQEERKQHQQLKDVLMTSLGPRGAPAPPLAALRPTAPLAPLSETEAAATASLRSVQASIQALQRLQDRFTPSSSAVTSAIMSPRTASLAGDR